ncbi:unnamed protein product, partial [Chrysoparadoxa australica]
MTSHQVQVKTKFPREMRLSMTALSLALFAAGTSLTSLFPYVAFLVLHLGETRHKNEAGYYAGFISGSFMLGRVATSYFWGAFSDRFGRKPVLLI